VNQAGGKNQQDNQADNRIEAVPLKGEADCSDGYARHWRGDEQQKAQLYQACAIEMRGRLDNSGKRLNARPASYESAIVDLVSMMPDEIQDAACRNHCGRQQDAGSQKLADDAFQTPIVHLR
jgi:hypothetical protein